MGFLGQMFSGGTKNGSATTVPTNQNILNTQNQGTYQQATAGVNNALGQQGNLQSDLQSQNGLGNQSSVYNQQQALSNQLAQQAVGQGPNPAQAQLNQNTATNTANQAALMAGQRGAGANPALLARQAAEQGAATQQNAVGQAATLQAQQQLGAESALGQQQQNMAGLASTQAGQQINNQQNLTNQQLSNQGQILGAIGQQNATQAGITNTQQQGQNQLNSTNLQGGQSALGGVLNAAGSFLAHGGVVGNPKLNAVNPSDRFEPTTFMPPHLKKMAAVYHDHHSYDSGRFQQQTKRFAIGGGVSVKTPSSEDTPQDSSPQQQPEDKGNGIEQGTESLAKGLAKGIGKFASSLHKGGNVGSKLKSGGKVPGEAKVPGDSETNDTVKAKLSPGEVVLPRSVMESDDPVSAAAQFVAGLKKQKGSEMSKGKHESDFKSALQRAIAGRKNK